MALLCNFFLSKIHRAAQYTQIFLCGCASKDSPAFRFPPLTTHISCLATGLSTSLAKRTQLFQKNIAGYRVTCNVVESTKDFEKNPYQDCVNYQAAVCNPTYITQNGQLECKNSVDAMIRSLSPLWKAVRISCAKWSFDGKPVGLVTSRNCINANNALKANAYYILPDGRYQYVDDGFIESMNVGLWGSTAIKA